MPSFISLVYLFCFTTLSLWLLFKDNKEIRKYFGTAFVVSFIFYLSYYLFYTGLLGYFKLAAGIVMIFIGGLVLNTFSSNKILFVLLLGTAIVGLWYFSKIPEMPYIKRFHQSELKGMDTNFELLVEMKPGKTAKDIVKIIQKYKLRSEEAFEVKNGAVTDLDDFIVLDIPENQLNKYELILDELKKSGHVDAIEQNEVVLLFKPQLTDKKTKGNAVTYLNDPELDKLWTTQILQFDTLHRFLAKKNIKPLKKTKIVIIDTGVEANHQDLSANYSSIRTEYDVDPQGHGTHCAGIAAAVTNNKRGIASFSPSNDFVEISSVQVFSNTGGTTQRNIIKGMILAIDNGADILSMSLGGPSTDAAQVAYRAVVDYASKKGVIIIAAAGNENSDALNKVPASVDGIIAVAATDEVNSRASFSNDVSKLKWAIAAPGVNIYSTVPGSRYDFMSGTSMATPYVAGLLGLLKAIDPTIDAKRAFYILNKSGKETVSGKKTGRLIQPLSAVIHLLN